MACDTALSSQVNSSNEAVTQLRNKMNRLSVVLGGWDCLDDDVQAWGRRVERVAIDHPADITFAMEDCSGPMIRTPATFKIPYLTTCAHADYFREIYLKGISPEARTGVYNFKIEDVSPESMYLYTLWTKCFDVRYIHPYFDETNAGMSPKKQLLVDLYLLAQFFEDVNLKNIILNSLHTPRWKPHMEQLLQMHGRLADRTPAEDKFRLFITAKVYGLHCLTYPYTDRDTLIEVHPSLAHDLTRLYKALDDNKVLGTAAGAGFGLPGFQSEPCFYHDHSRGHTTVFPSGASNAEIHKILKNLEKKSLLVVYGKVPEGRLNLLH